MSRTVAIGIQDFRTLIEQECFYVDKTDFIREWWDNKDVVTLIARPRRFGKTLTMSMVEYFFSNQYADCGEKLFQNLSIWREEPYRRIQGTYPVISLSFSNIKETDFHSVKCQIVQILFELYLDFEYLIQGEMFSESEKNYYREVEDDLRRMTDSRFAVSAVQILSRYIFRYYGKKVIILLDEYDTPLQEAYINGFWEELAAFTRIFFNSTFKTNQYMGRALMTGITRVSKESIFSDLNNLKVITTTSMQYADAFGFTEQEVFAAMEEYSLCNRDEVKAWYDGFIFGEVRDIYNPWSIINFLDNGELKMYWANTSSNSLVSKLVREGNPRIKEKFEELMQGRTIVSSIEEEIVYAQLDGSEAAVWGLLLASGYLKVLQVSGEDYELALTNYEVKRMFRNLIKGWFQADEGNYGEFIQAFLLGDIKAMNRYMNRIALSTFSYFDTGKRPSGAEPERFYHGFVLGLLVELEKEYIMTSNRESGFGRYDVMLEPRNPKKPAYILEFKVYDADDEENLQATAQAAIRQIEDKKYEQALLEHGISPEHINKYGFAFCGKEVFIAGK